MGGRYFVRLPYYLSFYVQWKLHMNILKIEMLGMLYSKKLIVKFPDLMKAFDKHSNVNMFEKCKRSHLIDIDFNA